MLHQHVSLRSAYQRDSSFNVNFILFYGFSERYLLPEMIPVDKCERFRSQTNKAFSEAIREVHH